MSTTYKLSVVVLVYNTEPYLRECFDSLVNQTLDDIEIIIVNDESPDNSLDIIKEYQSKYSNVKLINQKNSGGAIAGNRGISMASGEYVALMDSDDVVPLDAYEKLYNKAKQCDAEIVLGRAHILKNGIQMPVAYQKEREVWSQERIITDLYQYLDVFYDAFYWNKIFKREFLLKNDCLMPPGMLYADRPMVHKAFMYAKKIAIITDLVYLWRKRGDEAVQKSISQTKTEVKNFLDRVESYNYQINYFEEFGDKTLKNEFLKRNLDRLLFPIEGILEDTDFRNIYLKEMKAFFEKVEDIYSNDLGITKNLYIYMILNNMTDELVEFLQMNNNGSILEEDGKFYWALPYFRSEVGIPDEFFEVKELQSQFIKIDGIETGNQSFKIKNVTVPDAFSPERTILEIVSKKNPENRTVYELQQTEKNVFSGEIPFEDYLTSGIFDIYLIFYSKNREERFPIMKKMFSNPTKKIELFSGKVKRRMFFQGGKLAYLVVNLNVGEVTIDEEKMSIAVLNAEDTDIAFYLKDRMADRIYFQQRGDGRFELPWKHFVEPNQTFDLFMRVFNKPVRLHSNHVPKFTGQNQMVEGLYNELFQTESNNISLKSSTPLKRTLRKLLGKG